MFRRKSLTDVALSGSLQRVLDFIRDERIFDSTSRFSNVGASAASRPLVEVWGDELHSLLNDAQTLIDVMAATEMLILVQSSSSASSSPSNNRNVSNDAVARSAATVHSAVTCICALHNKVASAGCDLIRAHTLQLLQGQEFADIKIAAGALDKQREQLIAYMELHGLHFDPQLKVTTLTTLPLRAPTKPNWRTAASASARANTAAPTGETDDGDADNESPRRSRLHAARLRQRLDSGPTGDSFGNRV